MPTPSDAAGLVLDAVAVRRVTRLIVDDELTRPLREAAGRRSPLLGYLVSCRSCSSVWSAFVVAVLPRPLRRVLAMSELAIMLASADDALKAKAVYH